MDVKKEAEAVKMCQGSMHTSGPPKTHDVLASVGGGLGVGAAADGGGGEASRAVGAPGGAAIQMRSG